nr:unnamed protein product [Digitaria exilis]
MDTWLSFGNLTSFTTAWFVLGPLLATACMAARRAKALLELVDTDVTLDIVRRDWEDSIKTSDKYSEVKAYLAASCSRAARALRAENAVQGDNKLVLTMRLGQGVSDEFAGVTLWWTSTQKREEGERLLRRCYRLTFHHRHRDLVENDYWDRVWDFVYLKHPTTFDKLAMDPAKKEEIMDDLDEFRKGGDHYINNMGKPWKRGYLLYGPPGPATASPP